MNAITVRKKLDNQLICYGPDNGMYDPGYDPTTMVKSVEPDYEQVIGEWVRTQPIPTSRSTLKQQLANATTLTQLKTILQDLL